MSYKYKKTQEKSSIAYMCGLLGEKGVRKNQLVRQLFQVRQLFHLVAVPNELEREGSLTEPEPV